MAVVTPVLALAATVATTTPLPPAVTRWQPHIAEASRRCGVPVDWIARVIAAESAGQTMLNGNPIRSRAGAIGLMQLMPSTWETMRRAHDLGPDPGAPRDNIIAGSCYLRAMYDRFGYPGLFAAYNAGPGRYAAHLASGRPLPAETRAYLDEVGSDASKETPGPSIATAPPTLFVIRRVPPTNADAPSHSSSQGTLFAVRGMQQ